MAKICNQACPIKVTAEIIESKWTTLVLRELISGKKRYHELQKNLEGISSKVLAARLSFLLKKGLIQRNVFTTVPPTTEYELTDLGLAFKDVLGAMALFGEMVKSGEGYSKNTVLEVV